VAATAGGTAFTLRLTAVMLVAQKATSTSGNPLQEFNRQKFIRKASFKWDFEVIIEDL